MSLHGDEKLFFWPSGMNSPKNRLMAYAAKIRCFFGAHGQAFVIDQDVVAFIAALLDMSSPPAIIRTIWAVIVDAVQRVRRGWRGSHVCKEVGKVIPALTDRDSASTVPSIRRRMNVIAAMAHVHPNSKFAADRPIGRLTVLRLGFDNRRKPKAPATLFSSVSKLLCGGLRFVSAIACASPLHQVATIRGLFNNRQSTEAGTRKINEFSHAYIIHSAHSFGVR